jgi:hypothetical protein
VFMLRELIQNRIKKITPMRHVGFYFRRLRGERVSKVVVASVAAFAMVLQLTAGVFPFASTSVSAIGDDNIIRNGITSKEQLLAIYDSGSDGAGHTDIKQIYTHFGVSRQDIANATMGSYKTNDFNGQLKTIGRNNFPNTGRTAVAVEGANTSIYAGPFLDNAGNNANTTPYNMPALIGKRSVDGQWFAVTLNCGNIVYTVTPPPLPKPVPGVCTAVTATRTSRTNFTFKTDYTLGDDKFQSLTYVITDAAGVEVDRTSSSSYTQMKAGTYTVKAIVNVTDSKGVAKTLTSAGCAATFTVKEPVTPVSTVPKCPIVGKENLDKTHPDCKETPPTVMCPIVGKENLPKASPDCVEIVATVPTKPVELPKTGLGEDILKLTGLGSIIASVGYYAASRRGLLSAFLNR